MSSSDFREGPAKRPAIPADVVREILIECGYRCAVCGTGCPLERAHIVPWSRSHSHARENLICLCANCHSRADSENWGELMLQDFKRRPWVLRHFEGVKENNLKPAVRVRLTIEMSIEAFDERYRRLLRHALASFLDANPEDVEILRVEEGSVRVTIRLPLSLAEKLLSAHDTGNQDLGIYLKPFPEVKMQLISESGLAAVVAGVLGASSREIEKNPGKDLSILGLDSLNAVEISDLIRQRFLVDISPAQIISDPTLAGIWRSIDKAEAVVEDDMAALLAEIEGLSDDEIRDFLGVDVEEERN
jgi:acyl carrier protein